MSSNKPTILLIGGGWNTPQSYSKLAKQLESLGYRVHVPSLPSTNGSRPPNADLYSDSEHVRSVAQCLVNEGQEVVVVTHSYGGQVGTNALQGLGQKQQRKENKAGGISNLIYFGAHVVPESKAIIDAVKHFGHEHLLPLAFDFADGLSCVVRDPKTLLVGETDLPTIEVDEYLASLVRWNSQVMYQPLATQRAAWRDIPVTFIYTTKDMTFPFEYQKWYAERIREEGIRVQGVMLDAGHCPNFTAAKELADVVDEVAKGQLGNRTSVAHTRTSNDDVKGAIIATILALCDFVKTLADDTGQALHAVGCVFSND